jgi:cell division protein FtsB
VRTAPRVRWDRLGRIAMLGVIAVIACLYLSAGIRFLSSWRESRRDRAQVSSLEAQNHRLQRQHAALASPGTVQAEARRLGMIHPGEQAYVVSGLPSN